MLIKVGKSLILVTVVVTLVLVFSSSQPAAYRTVQESTIQAPSNEDELLYAILGVSLAVMSMLLIFLAIKGRSINVESPNANSSAISAKIMKDNTEFGSKAGIAKDLHSHDATLGIFELSKKNENWRIESSLVGSTLRMYWSLLCRKQGAIGLREIQRELGFSSPSSAVYQLDKLISLGLVQKDDMGDYIVRRVIKVGFLRDFVFVRGYPLPKSALFGALILLIDVTCFALLISVQVQMTLSFLAMLPGLVSSLIFWYEGLRAFTYEQKLIGKNASRND
jgi:predicted DNA-binding transcriptional regulator